MSDSYKVYASEDYVDKKVPKVEGMAHQFIATDSSGNPVWEDRTHGGKRITVEWDGTYDKSTDTPGSMESTFVNALFRYWKISDNVPSKAELFAEDTYYTTTDGEQSPRTDILFDGDGWYGRWNGPAPGYDFVGHPDGEWPLVVVVTKPVNLTANFSEPGIYTAAGSMGAKMKFASLTYGWFKQLDKMYIPNDIGGTQPDWNQNDPTAPDYVKNRPFYTEVVLDEAETVHTLNEKYIPDTIARKPDLTWDIIGSKPSDPLATVEITNGSFTALEEEPSFIVDGMVYSVVSSEGWHAKYTATVITAGKYSTWSLDVNSTDYPDCPVTYIDFWGGEVGYTGDVPATETLTIYPEDGLVEIVPIPQEYLPEDYIDSLIDAKLGVIENGTY